MDGVVHFEIPADDVARAKKFYAGVFGWMANDVPGMDYALITTAPIGKDGVAETPGAINGGMAKRGAPVTAPVITIKVASIDDALGRIEQTGGSTVRGKMPVGDMGYTAYFKDTEGNVVGLWQDKA